MARVNFNTQDYQPSGEFGALPEASYAVVVIETEIKATKAGTGEYLQLTYEVCSGEHQGRRIFDRLNINNPNKTAEDIGRRSLRSICDAVGIANLNDSDELLDKTMVVRLIVKKQEGYADSNDVKSYKPTGGDAPAAPARAAASKGAPAPGRPAAPGGAAPPWKRGAGAQAA